MSSLKHVETFVSFASIENDSKLTIHVGACKIAVTRDRLKTLDLANNIAKIMESFAIDTE